MSRIGRAPIKLQPGTQVDVADNKITVKGKLGELNWSLLPGITVEVEENLLKVKRADDSKSQRAFHGLSRALIQNMITGVTEGFQKILHIYGTGYSAEVVGPWLKLTLGFSHDILLQIPEGLEVTTEAVPRSKGMRSDFQSIITIKGIDKQLVGEFAAEVSGCRPPENYKGKGIRYFDEYVIIKAGKAGTK